MALLSRGDRDRSSFPMEIDGIEDQISLKKEPSRTHITAALERSGRPPSAKRCHVEVFPGEWDGEVWKYIICIRDDHPLSVLGGGWSHQPTSVIANVERSLQDFAWLEKALQEEFSRGLVLPCLTLALNPTKSNDISTSIPEDTLEKAMDDNVSVNEQFLTDWISDVLNSIRGQGEILFLKCPDVLPSESMETFLYRNIDNLPQQTKSRTTDTNILIKPSSSSVSYNSITSNRSSRLENTGTGMCSLSTLIDDSYWKQHIIKIVTILILYPSVIQESVDANKMSELCISQEEKQQQKSSIPQQQLYKENKVISAATTTTQKLTDDDNITKQNDDINTNTNKEYSMSNFVSKESYDIITSNNGDKKNRNNDPSMTIFHTKSSLLPYHPSIESQHQSNNKMINTMNTTIEPYFQAYNNNDDVNNPLPNQITKFWSDSHALSCLRRHSFTCSPNQVRDDFYTIDDGSTSLCVNEALANGTIVDFREDGDEAKDLILISGSNSTESDEIFFKSKGGDDDAKVWNQSAKYIGNQLKKQCRVPTTKLQPTQETMNDTTTTTTSYASSALYGMTGLAKYMTSNLSKGATYVLAKYDLADDPDEYGDVIYEDNDYEEATTVQQPTKLHFQLSSKDEILNIPLVISCCKCVLEYAASIVNTSDNPCGIRHENKLMLEQQGASTIHSFRTFCQLAGKYQLQQIATSSSKENQFIGTFMQQLNNTSNIDFLMRVLLSSNLCQTKDNVLAIFPTTTLHQTEQQPKISEIDVSIFQLTETKSSLETRLAKLQIFDRQMSQKAIQAKSNNQIKLALLYMKRRKHALQEIDHVVSMLLNIEQGLETINRSVSDQIVINAYQTCTNALKHIRTTNTEISSLENVDETVDELREEMEHVKDMTEAMSLGKGDAVEEQEILEEFEEMERQAMEEELNGLFPIAPQGVVPTITVTKG